MSETNRSTWNIYRAQCNDKISLTNGDGEHCPFCGSEKCGQITGGNINIHRTSEGLGQITDRFHLSVSTDDDTEKDAGIEFAIKRVLEEPQNQSARDYLWVRVTNDE